MIHLSLPWPPSTNTVYPSTRWGRRCLSDKGKAYHAAVQAAVAEAGFPSIDGPAAVWIQLFPPDRRRRDVGNHEKVLVDALVACHVLADDSMEYLTDLRLTAHGIVPEGEVQVFITKAEEA